MPHALGFIEKLCDAYARITRLRTNHANSLQLLLLENIVGQRVTLLAVVGEIVNDPGDACFRDGRVGRTRIHDGNFELEIHAEHDVRGSAIDGAEHGDDVLVERHLYGFGG